MRRSWQLAAPLVQNMSDEFLQKIMHSVTFWLKAASKSVDQHQEIFLSLCKRLMELEYLNEIKDDEPSK